MRPLEGGQTFTLAQYRARYATYKSDPLLQAAHAAAPWLLVWDDHEVSNDYARVRGQDLAVDMRARRAAAYRAYWEHMPFAKAQRPSGADMRIVGRLDWGRLARIHLLDDRQYRDVQVCPKPGRGGSNTVRARAVPEPRRSGAHPARRRAGALARRRLGPGAAVEPGRAADADGAPRLARSGRGGGVYWTDGWDGYAPARNRLLGAVAAKKVPGVVVLGGDVHSNYVADLKADYDDPAAAVVASEFCGTSITSLSLPQARIDAARPFNPHIHYGRSDQRGYMSFELDAKRLRVALQVVERPIDPESGVATAARFVVDAEQPGAIAA